MTSSKTQFSIHWQALFCLPLVFAVCTTQFAQDPPVSPGEAGEAEVLTRGPIHEAFAEQVGEEPTPGVVIDREPPEPIDEVPPELKPDGDDIIWIPGYWHWDDERTDFIWISGVWRKAPPEHRWVPGYWHEEDGKFQWISGFWVAADAGEIEYQSPPPASLEIGPSSIAPSSEYTWVPGCWVYQTNRYSWRPGYWFRPRTDYVWTPSHYVWTPRGCLYVRGYWDYPFANRGLLFSPVYFPNHVRYRSGYRYSPRVTLSASGIFFHLFIRPGHNHYYFGDYYGQQRHHYHPWFDYRKTGRHYDSFHANYHAKHHHGGVNYTDRYRDWHRYFANHSDRRPQRTLTAQHDHGKHGVHHADQTVLGRDLRELASDRGAKQRLVRIAEQQRQQVDRDAANLRQLGAARLRIEKNAQAGALSKANKGATLGANAQTTSPGRTPDRQPGRLGISPRNPSSDQDGNAARLSDALKLSKPAKPAQSQPKISGNGNTSPRNTQTPAGPALRPPRNRGDDDNSTNRPLSIGKGSLTLPNNGRQLNKAAPPTPTAKASPRPNVAKPTFKQPKVNHTQPAIQRSQPSTNTPRSTIKRPQATRQPTQPSIIQSQPKASKPPTASNNGRSPFRSQPQTNSSSKQVPQFRSQTVPSPRPSATINRSSNRITPPKAQPQKASPAVRSPFKTNSTQLRTPSYKPAKPAAPRYSPPKAKSPVRTPSAPKSFSPPRTRASSSPRAAKPSSSRGGFNGRGKK